MSVYDPKQPKFFNTLNIFLMLAGLTLGYLGWWFLPHWWPVFQLSGIMKSACYDAYHQTDDSVLLNKLVKDSQRTGLQLQAENFQIIREKYTPEEVMAGKLSEIQLKRGKSITIKMGYVARAQWPLTDRYKNITFRREQSTDLKQITWTN